MCFLEAFISCDAPLANISSITHWEQCVQTSDILCVRRALASSVLCRVFELYYSTRKSSFTDSSLISCMVVSAEDAFVPKQDQNILSYCLNRV